MTRSENLPGRRRGECAPEAALLLDVVSTQAGPSTLTRRLLQQDIDWTTLVRAALTQRLIAPLVARLQGLGEPLVPGDIAYALDFRLQTNTQRNAHLLETVTELAEALRRRGLHGLFIDGPTLALQAFASLQRRDPMAPALLVATHQRPAVEQLLSSLDFRPVRTDANRGRTQPFAVVYQRVDPEAEVKLCDRIVRRGAGLKLNQDDLFRRAVTMDDCAGQARAPCAADSLLLSAVRAGTEGWRALGAACDVAALAQQLSQAQLAQLRRQARAQRCRRMLELALRLAGRCGDDLCIQAMAQEVRARVLVQEPPSRQRLGVDWLQWRLRDGWRERLRYAAAARFASSASPAAAAQPAAVSAPVTAREAKARNESHWGLRSQSWERWAERGRNSAAAFNRALLDGVRAASGQRILDLACGVGDTSLDVAPVVGERGLVAASDLAFDMVSKAQRRARTAGLEQLQCCTLDMERLPFADGCFDAIVSRLGIMYAPYPERALAEACRVLRRGGRAAYLVCGPRAHNPILRVVHEVVTGLFALHADDAAIQPFRFAAAGSLGAIMERVGFCEVQETALELMHEVPAGVRFWQASLERGLGMPVEVLPPLTLAELDRRMGEAFAPFLCGAHYRLPSVCRLALGVRP